MRTSACIAAAVAALLLCACTELKVKRAGPGEIEGIPYTLPKKTFVITVTYEFKGCTPGTGNMPPRLEVARIAGVTYAIEPDENERFYIPYSSLRNPLKNTDFTIESWDTQTLKSVSAMVTDKTGDAITSAVAIASRLSAADVVTKAPEAASGAPPGCNAKILEARKEYEGLRGKDNLTAAEKVRFNELLAQLSHRETMYWPVAKPRKIPDQMKQPFRLTTTISPGALFGPNGKWVAGTVSSPERLNAVVELTAHGTVTADSETLPEGFLVRQGPIATLRVCEHECPKPVAGDHGAIHAPDRGVLYATAHVVPQLGNYVGLPLRNRLFEDQTLSIGLSAEGAIVKMGLKSNATAAAALKSVETNLDPVLKAKEARDKAEAEARLAGENARKNHADRVAAENRAVADCLAAQRAVLEKGGTVTGSCQ